MKKSNNRKRVATTTPNATPTSEQQRAQLANSNAVLFMRKELAKLYAGCEPTSAARVRMYLDQPDPDSAKLIDAWRKCGRNDRTRTMDIHLSEVARRTLTPLGWACLIAYAQAWLDEAEAIEAAATAQAG